jgi:competence protein ComEA
MQLVAGLKAAALAALVAGVVALTVFVLMERWMPSTVTISPGVQASIVVEMQGAVATPGVYELPASARLSDAVTAAGGLTDEADLTAINLAGRVGDGERIVVPGRVTQPVSPTNATPVSDLTITQPGLININTANVAELDQLPGVGPTIAQRIVDFRDFYGAFTSVDQLAEVEGISPAMVDAFRHLVTIGG